MIALSLLKNMARLKLCFLNCIFITGIREIAALRIGTRPAANQDDKGLVIVYGNSCTQNSTCPLQLNCDDATKKCLCQPLNHLPLLMPDGRVVCFRVSTVAELCGQFCSADAQCNFSSVQNLTSCQCGPAQTPLIRHGRVVSCTTSLSNRTFASHSSILTAEKNASIVNHRVNRLQDLFFNRSPQPGNVSDYLPALLTITFIFIVVFFVMGLPEYLKNILLGLQIQRPFSELSSRHHQSPSMSLARQGGRTRHPRTRRASPFDHRRRPTHLSLRAAQHRPAATARRVSPPNTGELIYCHLLLPFENNRSGTSSPRVITAVHLVSRNVSASESATEERVIEAPTPLSPPPSYYQIQFFPAGQPPSYEEAMKLEPFRSN